LNEEEEIIDMDANTLPDSIKGMDRTAVET
jgi:hypothetical protein